MKIKIDRLKSIPLYLQIKHQIEENIISGVYSNGFVLPSERKLAEELGVNRNTTIKAYESLKEDNLIDSKIGKGTFVIYEKNMEQSFDFYQEIYWEQIASNFSFENSADIMSKIMSDVSDAKMISLSGGFPSKDIFPQSIFEKISKDLLHNNKNIFFHTPVKGDKEFVYTLKNHLYNNKAIHSDADEIMISSGAQQGLNLIINSYIRPNDAIIIENPSFFGAIQLFKKAGARLITTQVKNSALDLDHIEYNLKTSDVKFIYLVPNYQNPTGYVMNLETRKGVLNLSRKYQVPIIEEDPYGELYYEKYTPSIKSLDRDNFVIYVGTFSKTIAPGFRIGYIVADETVIKKLTLLNQFTDIHANTLSQNLINQFIRDGYYTDHLVKVRNEYKFKRDLMMSYLDQISDVIEYEKPLGGYYIWCKIRKNISVKNLLDESIKQGIDFIPGEFFFPEIGEGKNYFRLNFTYGSREEIKKGMEKLIESINNLRGDY